MLANRIDQLLHLTLKPEETAHIVSYLKTVNMPSSHDLLVLHYLQQSKVIDAIQLESSSSASAVSLFCALLRKFAIKRSLNIPPHLKPPTTILREIYAKFAMTAATTFQQLCTCSLEVLFTLH